LLNRFSTGGLDTLKYDNVRDDLLQFHAENYSSNIMSLVMVGKDSIENLEQIAVDNFSDVPNKSYEKRDFSQEVVYDESSYGKIYKVVPHKDIKRISVHWNLPYSDHLWREKPGGYISYILGHEGPNSLLSYLIKEGLAISLSSGSS
jgi:insulysin